MFWLFSAAQLVEVLTTKYDLFAGVVAWAWSQVYTKVEDITKMSTSLVDTLPKFVTALVSLSLNLTSRKAFEL
jgi:hypothetical protein